MLAVYKRINTEIKRMRIQIVHLLIISLVFIICSNRSANLTKWLAVCVLDWYIYIYTRICIGLIPHTFIKPSLKCVPLYWFYVNKHILFQTLPKFNFLSPNIYTPIIFIFISCQRSPSALLLSPPCECIKTVAAEINSRLSLSVTES